MSHARSRRTIYPDDKSVEVRHEYEDGTAAPQREHLEAVWKDEGRTIDAIATDHAPHHADEKAWNTTGPLSACRLETAVGLSSTDGSKGVIDLHAVELCSVNPARISG